MDDIRQRLLDLTRESGASLSRLSVLIGRNSTYLQQFIRKGSPRKLEEDDRRILAQFFGVQERELGGPMDISYKEPSDSQPGKAVRGRAEWADIPRLSFGASAGPGSVADAELPFDSFRFSRRWLREKGLDPAMLSAIAVEGDSMEPLLRDGDEILVDRTLRPLRDGIHVVRMGDLLLVKRVALSGAGMVSLISENPAYPPLEVSGDDIEVIGRVVWKSGRL